MFWYIQCIYTERRLRIITQTSNLIAQQQLMLQARPGYSGRVAALATDRIYSALYLPHDKDLGKLSPKAVLTENTHM